MGKRASGQQIKHRNRSKKRKKIIKISPNNDELRPNPNNPSPPPFGGPDHRRWADLPEPLLLSILDHLSSSAADLVAFASSCRSWRSATAASAAPRGPPLLLNPLLCLNHSRALRWSGPPRCRHQTLTLASARAYSSPLSSKILARSCIGSSNGHLIFVANRCALLADAFTGRELRSPKFPSGDFNFLFGILTAPVPSESCSLLVVALNISSDLYSILCWSPGSKKWVELNLVGSPEIMSLVVFKGQVFGMDSLYRVLVIDLAPCMSWRLLDAKLSTGTFLYNYYGKFGQNLVECNGELFVVLLIPTGKFSLPGSPKIEVYSLDFSESVWVKKESLGDWCLFMDAVGKCSFACRDPGRWGGRRNCVYVAGPGYAGWSVFPLDGEAIDTGEESPLKSWYVTLPRWPSPVWVYPSMLL